MPDSTASDGYNTFEIVSDLADLFNAVYETTLQALSRYFVHSGETAEQVAAVKAADEKKKSKKSK